MRGLVVSVSIILISIALSSCAHILSQDIMNKAILDARFSEIKENPDFYKEKIFILGGMIIETKATEKGSSIEALYVPVDRRGQLLSLENTTDRYVAVYPKDRGLLDSLVFRKERKMTIAGKFIGLHAGKIEKMDYIYPVFEIKELHLWRDWKMDDHSSSALLDLEKNQKKDYATSQSFHIPADINDQTSKKASAFNRDNRKDLNVPIFKNVQNTSAMHELSESDQQQALKNSEDVKEIKDSKQIQEEEQTTYQKQALPEEAIEQDVVEKQSKPFIDDSETDKLPTHEATKSLQIKEGVEATEIITDKETITDIEQSLTKKVSIRDNKYYVQVGTWRNHNYALVMLDKVKKYYPKAYIIEHNNFNKIRIPGILTKEQGVIVSRDVEEKFNIKPLLVLKSKKSR